MGDVDLFYGIQITLKKSFIRKPLIVILINRMEDLWQKDNLLQIRPARRRA